MKTRSPLVLLLTALVTALLASLLVTTSTTGAQAAGPAAVVAAKKAPKPSQDFPRIPRKCATPQEKIPSQPVVCNLTDFKRARPSIVLWGDSHAWMFIPALRKAVKGRKVNLVGVMMGSCPPMDNQVRPTDSVPACFRSNALGIKLTRQLEASGRPYRILLNGSWQRYVHARKVGDRTSYVGVMAQAQRDGTPRLARTLRSIGAEVDVIAQVATVPEKHRRCAKGNEPYACQLPVAKALPEWVATRNYVRKALKPVLKRATINVNQFFCTTKVCKGKMNGVHTWFDDLHLSATRSRSLAPYFTSIVDAVAPRPVTPPDEPTQPGDGCFLFLCP